MSDNTIAKPTLPESPAPAPTNEQIAKRAVFSELREIGRSEGKGKTARLRAAEVITAKAKEGLLVEDDNRQAWQEIIQGAGEELLDVGGNDIRETQQFKQRCSDIKHFIVLGRNKHIDGLAQLRNAIKRMKHLRSTGVVKSGRIWELLLSFARNQNDAPGKLLTEAQIDKVMADKAAPGKVKKKDLPEKLWQERARLLALNEGFNIPQVYDCCEVLEKVVRDLGGTKSQKEEAKEAAKATAKTAKAKPKGKDKSATV